MDAANHIAGAAPISDDVTEQIVKLAKIDFAAVNKALSSCGVARYTRERLIQFMGDRCRQFTHHCHSAEMAQFVPVLLGLEFCLFPISDVEEHAGHPQRLSCFIVVTAATSIDPANGAVGPLYPEFNL